MNSLIRFARFYGLAFVVAYAGDIFTVTISHQSPSVSPSWTGESEDIETAAATAIRSAASEFPPLDWA